MSTIEFSKTKSTFNSTSYFPNSNTRKQCLLYDKMMDEAKDVMES